MNPSPFRFELSPLTFLVRAADVWADRPAVEEAGRCWTFAEHYDRVQRLAGALRGLGIGHGDRVATLLPNVSAMLELHYAVPGVGAVLVPLNTRLAAAEYEYILRHSGARLVVGHVSMRDRLLEAIADLGAAAPSVIWVDDDDEGEYENLLAVHEAVPLELPSEEDQRISLNYTSGTTGRPKGVMTTHRGAYLHTLGVIAEAGLSTRSAYLWTLPMFHCNGWAYTWAVTAMGAKHVCLPEVDVDAIWSAIHDGGVTHLCAAPTVVTMILGAEAASPSEQPVKLFIGGAPPTPALLERAARMNIAITHLYGLTETYGPILVCAWNPLWDGLPPSEQARLQARQGVPTIVSNVRVVDEQMAEVARDGTTQGEIVVKGNNVMVGYYEDPDATARAFEGGWFHTGDLAVVHDDGYIEIRDRLKDTIISGGENIATVEVEQALAAHPDLEEVAVVGAPDETWGEIVVAFVTPRPGTHPDPEELREFARGKVARFKVPKRITIVDDLPKTGTGKIQKFLLRERSTGVAG